MGDTQYVGEVIPSTWHVNVHAHGRHCVHAVVEGAVRNQRVAAIARLST